MVVVVVVVVVGRGGGGGYGDHLMYVSSSTKLHVPLQSSTYFIICQSMCNLPRLVAIQFHCLAAINIHTSPFIPGRLQCVK